ncbi:M17 family metallopeptidase [uncultured Cellulomonas sp.]|uniref:leucyl aminopeptidase family protein n=1 Tax=uncultured Cellulomonas sp. TaxID=189682 RepID=UPI00260E177B|nr:leucyl aminopeptidase family protein [uncultured Cellulomonas sp.]
MVPASTRALPEVVVERGTLTPTALEGTTALAVPVAPPVEGETELQPRSGTADAAALYGVDLAEVAERAGATGVAGDTWTLHLPRRLVATASAFPWESLPERLVLVGVGDGSPGDLRRAGAALARATRGVGRVVTTLGSPGGPHGHEGARALVEGYLLGSYRIPTFATGGAGKDPAGTLVLLGRHTDRSAAAVRDAQVAARATWLVRDLANTPSSTKDPAWMAERAGELAAEAGLVTQVFDPEALEAEGFGGILAVGAGSARTPRLVTVSYTPTDGRTGRHVVVVGKGITFDTGGLSIKPREPMVAMKTDMAGAAVALATVLAAAEAGVGHRVTAVLPLAENHVGASSYRPGDVLTVRGGRTVEVANTDAEGRLVLADALAYADEVLDPDVLIDVATLTGAATLGLGQGHAALYCADPALLGALEAAGTTTGERVWHMPLVEEYLPAVRSPIADLRHVPAQSPGGGSITAALFLREFTGSRTWAHLDIAGPARSGKDRHEVTEGATGFGARLLLEYLQTLA